MPFGLTNAPVVFQNMINDILRDVINHFVLVYLDDILVYAKDRQEYCQHVRQVLERLLKDRLFVKAKKCKFHVSTTSFLGFIISPGKITMDPVKVAAVKDWSQPETRKQLQRFLGFAHFYQRFICNYSCIVAPLTAVFHNQNVCLDP